VIYARVLDARSSFMANEDFELCLVSIVSCSMSCIR